MKTRKSEQIWVIIGDDIPSLQDAAGFVRRDFCGAVNVFEGITRNHHDGKTVKALFYDSYDEMALQELVKLCDSLLRKYPLGGIAVFHKTGSAPVGTVSLVTAISSAHRKDAIKATEELISTLKKTVPIWKKEYFEDGSKWKEEQ